MVVILIDTLRFDYLGCYGFDGDISPHLDALAEKSVRFDRCYSQAPWTKPSVASLFTSLFPTGHGITNHNGLFWGEDGRENTMGILSEDAVTLAECLRDLGYDTAAFVANPWLKKTYGFGQGFATYDDEGASITARAETVLQRAGAWLSKRKSDRPYFLYIHLMDVHGPYAAPESHYQAALAYPGVAHPGRLTPDELEAIPEYLRQEPWMNTADAARVQGWRARYAAGVRYVDQALGAFFRELEVNPAAGQPTLVVTSDHGEELHEHGGWDHGYDLYEHQIRVPLLVRLPGAAAGRVVDEVVRLVDLMPTLVRRGRGEPPAGIEGRDLSPLLEGRPADLPGVGFACASRENPALAALVVGRYKLVAGAEANPRELFDLTRDPGELTDREAEMPRLSEELAEHLSRLIAAQQHKSLFVEGDGVVTDETREQLRALGYID